MASPTTAVKRLDLSMSYAEFSLRAARSRYMALQLMPAVGVAFATANFGKVDLGQLMATVEDTRRAPRSGYKRGEMNFTQDSYQTTEHGVEEPLDDRQTKMYRDIFAAESFARDRAIDRVLRSYEDEVAKLLFSTTTFGSGSNAAVGTSWKTYASAKPIDDLMDAIGVVNERLGGFEVNTIAMTSSDWRNLMRCAQVIDRMPGGTGSDSTPKVVQREMLASILGVDRILVGQGYTNTKDRGQTAVLGNLWTPGNILVCRTGGDSGDLETAEPRIGNTIMWTDENAELPGAEGTELPLIIETYRSEEIRGDVVRARADWQAKMLHSACGYLLTGAAA